MTTTFSRNKSSFTFPINPIREMHCVMTACFSLFHFVFPPCSTARQQRYMNQPSRQSSLHRRHRWVACREGDQNARRNVLTADVCPGASSIVHVVVVSESSPWACFLERWYKLHNPLTSQKPRGKSTMCLPFVVFFVWHYCLSLQSAPDFQEKETKCQTQCHCTVDSLLLMP